MTQNTTTLVFTDEELKVLNDVVRQSKVTASAEELLLVKMGRSASPLLDIVFKIGSTWENRVNELQQEAAAAQATQAELEPVEAPQAKLSAKARKQN